MTENAAVCFENKPGVLPSQADFSDVATASVPGHLPWKMRSPGDRKLALINLFAVVVPPLGLALAIFLLWGTAFNLWYLLLLAGMVMFSAPGVTVGYHRLCTHRSFTTSAKLRYLFAVAGSMAVQGPVIRWCAEHRKHHQHSDTEQDPHSPHMSRNGSWGQGLRATMRGAYHAHMGWLFTGYTKVLGKYSADLWADPAIVRADQQFIFWVLVGLIFPAIVAGLISRSLSGVLLGFLWGGLVRVLLVHHITWSVNSVCHLWGSQPFGSQDQSRNNFVVALLAMGEGWHNNHHAFPASAATACAGGRSTPATSSSACCRCWAWSGTFACPAPAHCAAAAGTTDRIKIRMEIGNPGRPG